MDCIYIALFYSKLFTDYCLRHLPNHTQMEKATGCQPAHREQLEVQYLAQGHFDTWSGGVGIELATLRLLNVSSTF